MNVNLKNGVRSIKLDVTEKRRLAQACDVLRDLIRIDEEDDIKTALIHLVSVRERYETTVEEHDPHEARSL